MARWVVFFDDEPAMMAVRRAREPLHLAYLDRHADEIRIAGGLREAPGEAFVGGLWVLEVVTRARRGADRERPVLGAGPAPLPPAHLGQCLPRPAGDAVMR
ncbi:hypothetical protein [Hydrogenophaga sp.]|uniref:hypothetical protein n=1 Tax=Hydrogenophaga sp. TaxID=1904254 RepID=UPI00286E14B6|nr:hypothetical protein [Hydrogenophaga sp.]